MVAVRDERTFLLDRQLLQKHVTQEDKLLLHVNHLKETAHLGDLATVGR
jgi:hypothetical protein